MRLAETFIQEVMISDKKPNTTSIDGAKKHYHLYRVGTDGSGATTFTMQYDKAEEHTHEIRRGEVLPAGKDRHTHTLDREFSNEEK